MLSTCVNLVGARHVQRVFRCQCTRARVPVVPHNKNAPRDLQRRVTGQTARLHVRRLAHRSSVVQAALTSRLEGQPVELTLSTEAVQKGVSFTELRAGDGRTSIVAVDQVLPGGEADEAGVKSGDRLVALSDPIRNTEMVTLSQSASLRFVRDALRLRRAPTITLILLRSQPGSAPLAGSGGTQRTVREVLEEKYMDQEAKASGALPTTAARRIAKRQAYLEEVSKRNDGGFFAKVFLVVLGVPLAILLVAAQQGWLFRTYQGY